MIKLFLNIFAAISAGTIVYQVFFEMDGETVGFATIILVLCGGFYGVIEVLEKLNHKEKNKDK